MSDNLGTGKISSLFMKMVIPSVISQLVVLIYNMVDRIFIGHIPDIGSTALTGVGICMPVTLIVSAFAQLTGIGGAPLASMALGRNDKEEAERTFCKYKKCTDVYNRLWRNGRSIQKLTVA